MKTATVTITMSKEKALACPDIDPNEGVALWERLKGSPVRIYVDHLSPQQSEEKCDALKWEVVAEDAERLFPGFVTTEIEYAHLCEHMVDVD